MFTTCPRCQLNLQVTAGDLRVGQGYVRCGRCDRVFNSLLSLADELPEDDTTNGVAVGTMSMPALPDDGGLPDADAVVIEPSPAFDLSDDGDELPPLPPTPPETSAPAPAPRAESSLSLPGPGSSQITATLSGANAVVEETATGTFETIVLEGEGYLQTEELVEESEVDARLQELVRRFDLGEAEHDTWAGTGADLPPLPLRPSAAPAASATTAATAGRPDAEAEVAVAAPEPPGTPAATPILPPLEVSEIAPARVPEDAPATDDVASFPGSERPAPASRLYRAGSVVLALLLLGQVVHHYRVGLAGLPGLGAVLAPVYRSLGAPISHPPDLRAYEVRQLGGEPSPDQASRIIVRASVRNLADHEQPAPLLRVTLQDRFGNRIAGRDVTPADYARGGGGAMLAPDQRVDAEVTVDDPANAAVGFEIDACLAGPDGSVRCASELAAPPAATPAARP